MMMQLAIRELQQVRDVSVYHATVTTSKSEKERVYPYAVHVLSFESNLDPGLDPIQLVRGGAIDQAHLSPSPPFGPPSPSHLTSTDFLINHVCSPPSS